MILIQKGTNNYITVTLDENRTLTNPTYLFRFINDINKSEVAFIAQNISSYTYRYDQFLITETSGSNTLTSGVITLSPTGFWSYFIYEQTSTTNLDYRLSTSMVESGKVKVEGTDTTYNVYNNNPKTYIGYGTGA